MMLNAISVYTFCIYVHICKYWYAVIQYVYVLYPYPLWAESI